MRKKSRSTVTRLVRVYYPYFEWKHNERNRFHRATTNYSTTASQTAGGLCCRLGNQRPRRCTAIIQRIEPWHFCIIQKLENWRKICGVVMVFFFKPPKALKVNLGLTDVSITSYFKMNLLKELKMEIWKWMNIPKKNRLKRSFWKM